jgi:hypothetical protein
MATQEGGEIGLKRDFEYGTQKVGKRACNERELLKQTMAFNHDRN